MEGMSPLAPSISGEHMLGTTIMAVTFDGGVIVGADSRTSTGAYIANRVSDKLTPLHDRIYCCRSGSAADTQAVADIVKTYLNMHSVEIGDLPEVQTAANLTQSICYENKDGLMAGIIIGGWDKRNGGSVYAITLGGSMVKQNYSIGGSGSTYIYGFCDSHYKVGMTKAECQEFVKKAISHAMARDGSSGGVIRMATIDESGVEKIMVPGDALPYLAETAL